MSLSSSCDFGAHPGLDQQSSCEKELGSLPPLPFLPWLFQLNLQHWHQGWNRCVPELGLSNGRWGKAPGPGKQRTHSSREVREGLS